MTSHSKDDRGERKPGEGGGNERKTGQGSAGWPDMQGEGNRDAAREYNESQRQFVKTGNVEEAARDAAPTSDSERRDMEDAEREGRSHAKK